MRTKPFNGFIEKDLAYAKKRVQEENKPCGILIVSPPGRGKTTLAVHFAEEYEGKQINFKDYIGNGFDDFNRVLAEARRRPEQGCVIYDEGGDVSKRKAMSDTNFKVQRILELARGFKKLIIFCIQDFSSLDRNVLNREVFQLMYYIPWRGKSYAKYSCYSLNRMFWLLNSMKKLAGNHMNPQMAYRFVSPNYRGDFYNLSVVRAEELDKYSTGSKDVLLDVIAGIGGEFETFATIMTITGKGREWVRLKLKEKGIKAVKKIKNKNVYAVGTAEMLTK